MSERNRSRQSESQDLVPRRFRRGQVSRLLLDDWLAGFDPIPPGRLDWRRHGRPRTIDIDSLADEVLAEIRAGWHLSAAGWAQALDGPLTLSTAVRDEGFGFAAGTVQRCPRDGYVDMRVEVGFEGTWVAPARRDATLTVSVDGEARHPTPLEGVALDSGIDTGVLQLGHIREDAEIEVSLVVEGAPEASWVRVSMQLVDRQIGEVGEPPVEPIGGIGDVHDSTGTQTHSIPAEASAGDLLLVGMGGRTSTSSGDLFFAVTGGTLIDEGTVSSGDFRSGRHAMWRLTLEEAHIAAGEFEYEATGNLGAGGWAMSGLIVPGGSFDTHTLTGPQNGDATVSLSGATVGFGMTTDATEGSGQVVLDPEREELWRFPPAGSGLSSSRPRTLWFVPGDTDTVLDTVGRVSAWHVRLS